METLTKETIAWIAALSEPERAAMANYSRIHKMALYLATMPHNEQMAKLAALTDDEARLILKCYELNARPDQIPPPGCRCYFMVSGRNAGKTWAGSNYTHTQTEIGERAFSLAIGPTADITREVMIEGRSGLIKAAPPWFMPVFEASNHRLVYPNGAICHVRSGEDPDRLRGLDVDFTWVDELAWFSDPREAWSAIDFVTRQKGPKGAPAQIFITSTPRPLSILKEIIATPGTVVSRVSTYANAKFIDPATLEGWRQKYEGTDRGRQEMHGELLDEIRDALFPRAVIERNRVKYAPESIRTILALDPAVSSDKHSDECGIIVASLGVDGHVYVRADLSGRMPPERWARRTAEACRLYGVTRVIAEKNQGGDLITNTLKAAGLTVPVRLVWASVGKAARADPISLLAADGKIHHVGCFPELEDELCTFNPLVPGPSPNRLDAFVWACTELLMKHRLEDRPQRPEPPRVIALYAR
jgi:phage terminase large subunit-like protein